jgi:MFS family permease
MLRPVSAQPSPGLAPDDAGEGPRTETPAYLGWVVFVLFWVQALNIVDRHVFGLAIHGIKAEFELSDQMLGALAGLAFALFYSVAGIPVARWADRGVRRSIIALSLFLWSGMTAACGLAQNAWQLALARVLVGVGEAGGSPPSHSLVTDYFPLAQRGRAMGLVSMGGSVGIVISLALGGWIAEHWGWRPMFLWMGIPGVGLALLIQLTLREPPRGRFDVPGQSFEPVSLRETLAFLGSVPAFLHISLAGSLYSFAGYGAAIWNPVFLDRVHGFNMAEAGLELTLRSAIFAIVSVAGGGILGDWLAKRDVRWYQWMPALGGLVHFPFAVAFLLWPDAQTGLWFLVPSALLGGLWAAPGHAMVQSLARPQMRATASALMLLLFNLIGFGLGPWLVGLLNDLLEPRLGAESVRWSLFVIVFFSLWAAAHNFLAARTLARDLRAKDAF